jgi:Transposase zinc-binding domain
MFSATTARRTGKPTRTISAASSAALWRRIEACRTPALGGHVERCADCGFVRCAYNSCLMGKSSNGELAYRLPPFSSEL